VGDLRFEDGDTLVLVNDLPDEGIFHLCHLFKDIILDFGEVGNQLLPLSQVALGQSHHPLKQELHGVLYLRGRAAQVVDHQVLEYLAFSVLALLLL